MSGLLETLASGRVLLCDGAMGTMLQGRGLQAGECPEQWNLTHPDVIGDVARLYIEAGSDIVETNSFGGTTIKLDNYGLAEQVGEINQRAAELARQVAGADRYVFGSMGPTGALMEPYGDMCESDIRAMYREQIEGLVAGGVDGLYIETVLAIEEAKAALGAVKESCDLPVIVTFTFDKTSKGEYRTMMGVSPSQVAAELVPLGADIIGSNCGRGIEDMINIAEQFRQETDCYLMVQPNAGLPEVDEQGNTVFRATPQSMSEQLTVLLDAGVNIVGGCCGTTPDHIRAFREVLDRRM